MIAALREKLIENIERADTIDLLDRVTAFRKGMEPEAIDLVEAELWKRGVTRSEIEKHRVECEQTCLYWPDGTALECSLCRRPAVSIGWGWHRMLGKFPIFPRRLRYCQDHRPAEEDGSNPEERAE